MKMVGHSDVLLSKCAQFREEGLFTDVQLQIGKTIFSAHRMVLAAYSDYFYAMFTNGMKESTQEVIELKDESISSDVLKIVVDSIYTGDLHVNEENVFEVLAAADHLQVISVVQQCCDYLLAEFIKNVNRFNVGTFCRIWTTADRHGLKDLQEAAEHKMASMYEEVCESEEFLSHINAKQFLSVLGRDDLSAPSETFVFKSVMQWIKHKKEERMAVAAKIIGAVRLGLVDIGDVIEELNTEEMQQVPDIHMHLHESLMYDCRPSNSSKFAVEKAKPRSMSPVLVAVRPEVQMQYYDVENKMWKSLASTAPQVTMKGNKFLYADSVGSKLFVGGRDARSTHCLYCYDTEENVWENIPHSIGAIGELCSVGDYLYAILIRLDCSQVSQRYNFAKRRWQRFAKLNIPRSISYGDYFLNSGATVFHSKVYVLYGSLSKEV
ncbi:kelch-like protein 12 isoform X2 [Oculina patagonica]